MNARMALIIEGLRSEREHLVAELDRINGAIALLAGPTPDDVLDPSPPAPAADFRCPMPGCDFVGKNSHSLSMHNTRKHKPKKAVESVVAVRRHGRAARGEGLAAAGGEVHEVAGA